MPDMNEVVARTIDYVRQTLADDRSGHDWWHIDRVRKNARQIAIEEHADLVTVELAALLHDIADWKFHGGDESAGPRVARNWLIQNGVNESTVDDVASIIAGISFKGAGVSTEMPTLEGKCVQSQSLIRSLSCGGILFITARSIWFVA